MSSYTFTWPSGPRKVVVTGDFDNWSQSYELVKQVDGSFELTIPFPKETEKIFFKFVVDDVWQTTDKLNIETDESGNANNVLYISDFATQSDSKSAAIPEAGGLSVPVAAKSAGIEKPSVNTTVMPSSEGQQQTLGEPGIVIPQNPHEIEAFTQVRTLDPKALNEPEEDTKAAAAAAVEEPTAEPVTEPATEPAPEASTAPVGASGTDGDLTSETSSKKVKYVKKVVTKVKKGEEEPVVADVDDKASAAVPKKVETSPSKKSPPSSSKKVEDSPGKKRGFFSKIKKALK